MWTGLLQQQQQQHVAAACGSSRDSSSRQQQWVAGSPSGGSAGALPAAAAHLTYECSGVTSCAAPVGCLQDQQQHCSSLGALCSLQACQKGCVRTTSFVQAYCTPSVSSCSRRLCDKGWGVDSGIGSSVLLVPRRVLLQQQPCMYVLCTRDVEAPATAYARIASSSSPAAVGSACASTSWLLQMVLPPALLWRGWVCTTHMLVLCSTEFWTDWVLIVSSGYARVTFDAAHQHNVSHSHQDAVSSCQQLSRVRCAQEGLPQHMHVTVCK